MIEAAHAPPQAVTTAGGNRAAPAANPTAMRYPIAWRLNLLIISLQLAATAAIFYGTARAATWWQIGLLALAFAVVGNSIYAIIHEAHHGILHPNLRVNDALGVAMSLLFPAPFHLIRQGHLGHHIRNRSDDEAFDFYFAGESPLWKCLQLYGTMLGMFWVIVAASNVAVLLFFPLLKRRLFAFDRPSAAFMDALNPAYRRAMQMEALGAIVLHALIIWSLGIPPLRYLAVYFGFGLSWSAMQYVHHFGTTRDVLDGSRDLWLAWPIDALWLNHNWHRTHHRHPVVPWGHLPALGRAQTPRRDFLLWHYLRMWRGPRRATEHVENRHAGQVSR